MKRLSILFLLCFFLPAGPAWAFGRNKVVADAVRWRVAKTAHFDIYYTDDSQPILADVSRWSERAYDRLTRSLGVIPSGRTPLFIYSTHNRFEQNNVADVGEGTGGVTEAFKNRVVVFNSGSQKWLKHVITHEFAHVLQFEALYGGFWKSARLLKSPLYPLWIMEGIAEHGIGDMDDPEEDLYLRDAALSGRLYSLTELHGFNHLKPHQVTLGYKSGASFVRFLAEEYGSDAPGRVLKGMRDRFDAAGLAAEVARQDFRALDARWREYLTDRYRAQAARLKLAEPETHGTPITSSGFIPAFHDKPALSPDGTKVAFLSDANGAQEVALMDLETGVTRLLAGRQWGLLEHIHSDGRALSFSPDGRWLAFAGEKEQRDFLYLYDIKRGRLRRVRTPFEQIRSPVFHPSEEKIVVVGMRNGTNDLYELSPRGKLLRRLTETSADESDPAYSPDGRALAFSLEISSADAHRRSLALLEIETLSVRLLTDMRGEETSPAWTPEGNAVVFVGEALEGVRNLYRLELETGEARLLTRVLGGHASPHISRDGKRMVFSSFRKGSRNVYLAEPTLWDPPPEKREKSFAALPDGGPWAENKKSASSDDEEPVVFTETRPYRFAASTDLFFPLFYYSSQDGFFAAALWSASDQMGNHALQTSAQFGSGTDFLNYRAQYSYRRFRPDFFAGVAGDTYYQDFERVRQRRERERFVGVSYPLDRFQRIEVLGSAIHREERLRAPFSSFGYLDRENTASLSFVRDTSVGRWLAVTDGSRFRLTQTAARPVLGGTREYDATQAEMHRFLPTGGESALAFRGIAGVSGGPSPRFFRVGGGDRLRGYPRNGQENQASHFALGNLEWRAPLKYMGGAGVSLLPEIAFKAIFGTLFVDAGYDWTPENGRPAGAQRWRTSVGAGVRIPSFILQTYPVVLTVDAARRTDTGAWSWYFSLGPQF